MKLLNIDENIPKVFYIFVGLGKNKYAEINYHNYNLSKRIISSGFTNLLIQKDKINDFINGNIIYTPFILNKVTFNSPSSHLLSVVNGYNVEYVLETIRANNYKKYPSRFSCVYAFGDYESCKKASMLYGWDISKAKMFKLIKTKTELDKCIKVAKCNMEIVTCMWNCNLSMFPKNDIDLIANAYWNGVDKIATDTINIETGLRTIKTTDTLYEYLIEGILEEIQ